MVSGKVAYDHSFSSERSLLYPSVTLNMSFDDYEKDINCGGLNFWGIQIIEHTTGKRFVGSPRFVNSEVLSQEFTFDLAVGDYEEITFICSDDGENEAFQFGSIENNLAGDQVIFSAQLPTPELEENQLPLTETEAKTEPESSVSQLLDENISGVTTTSDIDGVETVITLEGASSLDDIAVEPVESEEVSVEEIVEPSKTLAEIPTETLIENIAETPVENLIIETQSIIVEEVLEPFLNSITILETIEPVSSPEVIEVTPVLETPASETPSQEQIITTSF